MKEENILTLLKEVDLEFHPNLSKKTDLHVFAKKAIEIAHCEYEEDETGNLKGLVVGYNNDIQNGYSYISLVAVSPNCRKQGIAKKLITQFIAYTKNLIYIQKIGIHTNNNIALMLYQNIGFEIVSECDGRYYLEYKL